WRELPPAHRYNVQLRRQEDEFLDWDCSADGFEGVRAQDILPLLLQRFHFELFVPFGNVIDPFIDRSFGPNFDRESERDRAFIDRVQAIDEQAMLEGCVKPTHMFAVLRNPGPWPRRHPAGLAPERCVRTP
ncbi:MAG: class I SAM-dependent methyltransferase, partial [Betaproteobacteria bacterium]